MKNLLIINADDFGLTKGINSAIFDLLSYGSLSSTSVMVNMKWADEICLKENLIRLKGAGLHLNLTEGHPVSKYSSVSTLIDANGLFYPFKEFLQRLICGSISFKELQLEIEAQFKKLKQWIGRSFSHWDSHQGVHRLFPIALIAARVALKYRVPAMRVHRHFFLLSNKKKLVEPLFPKIGIFGFRRIVLEQYYRWLASFFAKDFFQANGIIVMPGTNTIQLLKKVLDLPQLFGVFEIPFHPATDIKGITHSRLTLERVSEYNYLISKCFRDNLRESPIKIISYSDLNN